MKKEFKNIQQQIEILKKRNLIIEDEESVKRYLLNNNYYDIINQYSKFFMVEKDIYDSNVTFKDIKAVHNFDKAIKRIFSAAILEMEQQFKSIIAYRYSEYFFYELAAYLKIENYEVRNEDDEKEVRTLIKKLERIIKTKVRDSSQNSVKHYFNTNNKIIPLWVLVDCMTLGHINYFYKYMPTKIKNKVNRDLSYFVLDNCKKEKLSQFINNNAIYLASENIRKVRNIVAHNSMLLNYKCEYDIPYNNDVHENYSIMKTDNKQDIFNVFVTLQYFLEAIQFSNKNNSFRKAIKTLKKEIPGQYFLKILNSTGFKELEKL